LFIAIAVVAIVGGVWYGLSNSREPEALLTTSTPGGAARTEDQQLVATLLALRAVTLESAIFDDPSFVSLRDFSTTIVPEPVGRENPFAPLSPLSTSTPDTRHTIELFTPAR